MEAWENHPYCLYCGRKLELKHCSWDHVVPLSKGGDDSEDNKVISCFACNRLKGDMDIWVFLKAVVDKEILIRWDLPLEVVPYMREKEPVI